MRRVLPHLFLLLALILQSVATAAVDAASMEHCAGHMAADQDCTCCPDGAMDMTGCAVQCLSVQQAPVSLVIAVNVVTQSPGDAFIQRSICDPAYAPLIPPPIA
jgi:hypothetical protein